MLTWELLCDRFLHQKFNIQKPSNFEHRTCHAEHSHTGLFSHAIHKTLQWMLFISAPFFVVLHDFQPLHNLMSNI